MRGVDTSCNFCGTTVESMMQMKIHLETMHADKLASAAVPEDELRRALEQATPAAIEAFVKTHHRELPLYE